MAEKKADVVLVGSGIMSATLGILLHELDPALNIIMLERLDDVAKESTDGWNNAGTGHAAYCELNYTPRLADGSIDIQKAVRINTAFEMTLEFWTYLEEHGALPSPKHFVNRVPHTSFVKGDRDIAFLKARYETLKQHHLFKDIEYSEDLNTIKQWMPLVIEGRNSDEKIAATRVGYGTDVDFGSLTVAMIDYLKSQDNFELLLSHQVDKLKQNAEQSWQIQLKHQQTQQKSTLNTRFVFLGAGGGSLPLLQKSGIPESRLYGGFPVGGQWLICKKPEIVEQHLAKVYGKAPAGAPPMSIPHLDTRIIRGESALLFGPFAGFTTRFLKQGSLLDLIKSVTPNNLIPMLVAGVKNLGLIKYLITEVLQTHKSRMQALREHYPLAKDKDWTLIHAGQRVQIIKKKSLFDGQIEFGTEVVTSKDGSLAALLGASPGASVAVKAMVELIETCFPERTNTPEWQDKMLEMLPSYHKPLEDDEELLQRVRKQNLDILGLNE
jgi:malate dehydrogenase (quinone)